MYAEPGDRGVKAQAGDRLAPGCGMHLSDVLDRLSGSDRPAILTAGKAPLSGLGLHSLVRDLWAELANLGCEPDHRIAIVGPSTAEMAVVILAVAANATAAPLNPRLTVREFQFEFSDLHADLVLVHESAPRTAAEAAQSLGLPWLAFAAQPGAPAGVAWIEGRMTDGKPGRRAMPDSGRAFVLHTSGTTGKPKTVPLLHDRILISARNIAQRLGLSRADRALSLMPLFHVHALGTVLLPTLFAGGSLYFASDFASSRFFAQLEESEATWYSAVPSIHHAILARAAAEGRSSCRHNLRLVRSSSAALPEHLYVALENFFGVPIIESYGMTEVEQICSGELPPAARKPGSVGRPGGPEVIVAGETGQPVPTGNIGEVCVRGANVFPGYDEGDAVNAASFAGAFFRTGDVGRFDEDGFLWLLGRRSEIINRGGEKISPGELEEAIARYPGVIEAAAFGIPHPVLGQVAGAAVVTRDPAAFEVKGLKEKLAETLALFKLPDRIWLVDDLPKGPTGKLIRHELRERLVNDLEPQPAARPGGPPGHSPLENALLPIWRALLETEGACADDAFLDEGADSLMLAEFFERVEQLFDQPLPLGVMVSAESVRSLAAMLEELGWTVPAAPPGAKSGLAPRPSPCD